MDLAPLYTLSGTAVTEQLGKVQDGERIKIEFRGKATDGSPVAGKAHGSNWVLIGPLGPGTANAVQELITPAGERACESVTQTHPFDRQENNRWL